MADYANELRRYARKLGGLVGDTPSVMAAAADHIDTQEAEIERLMAALRKIAGIGEHADAWSDIDAAEVADLALQGEKK